ncbi:MAG: hypothetical protein AB7T22_13425 [Calditrichaceae bacterium]
MKKTLLLIFISVLTALAGDSQTKFGNWFDNFDTTNTWSVTASYGQGNYLAGFRDEEQSSESAEFSEIKIHFIRDFHKEFGYGLYLGRVFNKLTGSSDFLRSPEVYVNSNVTYGTVYAYINGKYIGFKIRLLAYEKERAFYEEDHGTSLLPTFEIKIGLINRLYLKYSAAEDAVLDTDEIGLVYHFNNYFTRVEISNLSGDNRDAYCAKFQMLFFENFILDTQFIQDNDNSNQAFRLGMGYIF